MRKNVHSSTMHISPKVGNYPQFPLMVGLMNCVYSQGFPGGSAGKESACNAGDSSSIPGSGRSAGEGIGCPLQDSWASLVAQLVKNLPAMQGDLGSIPGLGRSPGGGKGYSLQYSGLENSMGYSPWGHKELEQNTAWQ